MDPSVRTTKRADELATGDWVAAGLNNGRIDRTDDAEVLFVRIYSHGGAKSVAMTIQEATIPQPSIVYLDAGHPVGLLTEDELAAVRDSQRRILIAEQLRAVADLMLRTDVPLPQAWSPVTVELSYPDAELVAAFAAALGVKVVEAGPQFYAGRQIDGDSGAGVDLHALAYRERKPDADPTGLAYSRADDEPDDPTPVSPARVPLHTGGVTDSGLVDETAAEPVHMDFTSGESMCGLSATTPHKRSLSWGHVTCQTCIDAGQS